MKSQVIAAHLLAMKPPMTSIIMKTKHITKAAVSVLYTCCTVPFSNLANRCKL